MVATIDAIEVQTFVISSRRLSFESLTIFHLVGFE